jgi:hypothetical protein
MKVIISKSLNIIISLLTLLSISLISQATYAAGVGKTVSVLQEPFQWEENNIEFAEDQLGVVASFYVPNDRNLVIEFFSAEAGIDIGNIATFTVITTVNGTLAHHRLVPIYKGPAGGFAKSYGVSQEMRVYADAGTEVRLYAGRTDGGRGALSVSLSGYLVNID